MDELVLKRDVYSQKSYELLGLRLVGEVRERELSTLCSQSALFVIPRATVRRGTKTVRGKFLDALKNGRVTSRFVAAEVTRHVRYDVHAETSAFRSGSCHDDGFRSQAAGPHGKRTSLGDQVLKRKLRWSDDELCFSWIGTRHVEELAKLLGHTGDRAVTKTRTSEAKVTGSGARDALELSGTFQATGFRTAVGMFGHIVLDRPDCQFAAKAVMNKTREPRMLD